MRPLFGLASGEVCRATSVTRSAVRSYRTLSPLPDPLRAIGGLLSVALSIGLRLPGVTRHRISVKSGLSSRLRKRPSDPLARGTMRETGLIYKFCSIFLPDQRGKAQGRFMVGDTDQC